MWKPQVLDALTSLGWTEKDANAAIDAYVTHNPGAENEAVGAALRGVLASLGAQNTVGRANARRNTPYHGEHTAPGGAYGSIG